MPHIRRSKRNKDKPNEESIKIQAISGHLDSKLNIKCNDDFVIWYNSVYIIYNIKPYTLTAT